MEPPRWIEKYEWRHATDMEICAIATLWKSIGDSMGIQYQGLLAHNKWADGLDFYYDICNWAEEYEVKHLVSQISGLCFSLFEFFCQWLEQRPRKGNLY